MATTPRRAAQICRLCTSQKIVARRYASRARERGSAVQGRDDAVWVGAGHVSHGAEDAPVARAPAHDAVQLSGEFFLRYLGLVGEQVVGAEKETGRAEPRCSP